MWFGIVRRLHEQTIPKKRLKGGVSGTRRNGIATTKLETGNKWWNTTNSGNTFATSLAYEDFLVYNKI